jgi:5-methylcytosine-specific restriction enzyme A
MMPIRPLSPCTMPGCPRRATQRGRCAYHAREVERARGSAAERGYDREWRLVRAAFLRHHPECVVCGRPAEHVHHVRRVRDGGTHHDSNLVALCAHHHNRETAMVDTHRSYERRG